MTEPKSLTELAMSHKRETFPEEAPEQWGWAFVFVGEDLMEVLYIPAGKVRQVQDLYPNDKVRWLQDFSSRCRGTEAERLELEALIAVVMPGDTASQRKALIIAMADPDAALTSFRARSRSAIGSG